MNGFKQYDDDTLVELTLLGNHEAYETFVLRYEKKVVGTAYKITKNRFSAEDASQDAFVSAWLNLSRLRETEKFCSWVCSIAKNSALNIVKHYKNAVPDICMVLARI